MSTIVSGDLLARLRRSVAMSGVLVLTLTAGVCGDDDDDDDGGTGPSADCIDEIDYTGAFFDDDDVQAINIGQSRNGTISESDPAAEFQGFTFYYDIYTFAVGDGGRDVTISVNPSGEFDADVLLATADGEEIAYSDDFDDTGATEVIEEDLDEGCYVIGVSSPFPETTGSYSISID